MNEKRISDTTLHVLFSNGAKTVKQPTKISKSDWDYFSSIYVCKSREKRSHGDWSPTGKQHSRRGTCKGPKHRSTFSPVQSALASKLAPLRQRRTQNEFRWKRKKAVRDGLPPNPILKHFPTKIVQICSFWHKRDLGCDGFLGGNLVKKVSNNVVVKIRFAGSPFQSLP